MRGWGGSAWRYVGVRARAARGGGRRVGWWRCERGGKEVLCCGQSESLGQSFWRDDLEIRSESFQQACSWRGICGKLQKARFPCYEKFGVCMDGEIKEMVVTGVLRQGENIGNDWKEFGTRRHAFDELRDALRRQSGEPGGQRWAIEYIANFGDQVGIGAKCHSLIVDCGKGGMLPVWVDGGLQEYHHVINDEGSIHADFAFCSRR